jgi:hypothetical protein
VRDERRHDRRGLPPERHDIVTVPRQVGDAVDGAFAYIRPHGRIVRRARGPRNTSFLEWPGAARCPSFAAHAATTNTPRLDYAPCDESKRAVTSARSPEELETLFEDAFVTSDRRAVVRLFEDGAVLGATLGEARGGEQISRLAAAMWERDYRYLADPQRVLQARDTALVIGPRGINVVRRGSDGGWRYAISLLDEYSTEGEPQ